MSHSLLKLLIWDLPSFSFLCIVRQKEGGSSVCLQKIPLQQNLLLQLWRKKRLICLITTLIAYYFENRQSFTLLKMWIHVAEFITYKACHKGRTDERVSSITQTEQYGNICFMSLILAPCQLPFHRVSAWWCESLLVLPAML